MTFLFRSLHYGKVFNPAIGVIMSKSAIATASVAALLLLSACDTASRDPGYVCMHDCAHYCPDGISGDQCRHNIQLQQGANATDNGEFRRDEYYPDGDRGYYYGYAPGTYVTVPADGYTTTTTTKTTTYSSPY